MTTYSARAAELKPRWYVIDAQNQVLGRLATQVATILRGKHKPTFTPNLNCGDFVIVINADKVAVTGDRMESKLYHRHSGYPGGLKTQTLRQMMEKHSDRVIKAAVKGMLPHNRLGDDMLDRLKIYGGAEHPHQAQKPEPWHAFGPADYEDIVRVDPVELAEDPTEFVEEDETNGEDE